MARWALAGAGWMAAVHGLAIRSLGGHEVVAVASRTTASATALATETGGRVVSLDDLPADADIVVVATPPGRHARDVLRAAAEGRVVVVEKPLCTTLEDADRLVRVQDAGGLVVYAENLLFSDVVGAALSEIAALGPLHHLHARTLQARPDRPGFTQRAWGGGVMFDLGVHPIAVVLRAANSAPVAVTADYHTSPDIEVEDLAVARIRFATGLTATVETSWRATSPTWDVQAASDRGAVRLELLPTVELERNGETVTLPAPRRGDHPPQLDQFGYIEQLRVAAEVHRTREPHSASDIRFGRAVLEVVCAAAESARTGREVALPYIGPRGRTPVELWRPEVTTTD